jgi:hypothetical protein
MRRGIAGARSSDRAPLLIMETVAGRLPPACSRVRFLAEGRDASATDDA